MEHYQNSTHSISLKEDTSRTELLPAVSEVSSLSYFPTNNGHDSAAGLWPHRAVAIKGWPEAFKNLRKPGWKKAASLVLDILIALLPLVFIVLSIVAIRLSGSPISPGGDMVKAATNLGPTVFPILFAAIVGRSLRSLASFQAERGAKLGTLEQLMGSLTIFGTVELQVLLRTFDVLGIGLVLLWALSPLGGQASLRLLESGTQSTSSNQSIPYLNPEAESILVYGGDTVQEIGFYINALYIAALFTAPAIQASPVDTWSNVKVPIIEKLESTSKSDADGWYAVSPENASYSSLVGLPVDATLLRSTPSLLTSSNPNGTRRMGSYFFSVESIYMTLDCPTVSDFTLVNGTTHGGFFIQFENSTQLILYPNQTSYPTVEPWRVDFSALSNIASDNAFTANCTLTRSSVESNVTCDGGSCSVTQIRRSLFDQRPPGWTPLNYGVSMGSMEDNWPLSGGNKISGRSTPTEYFISDPTMDSLSRARFSGGISLKGVSAEDFSERLSLVFNTYWQCSIVPWYRTGNFPNNASALNDDPSAAGEAPFNTTTTLVTTLTEIYVCNGTWAVILLAASTALLLCGLCGAIVKHKTRGPKILGYVSTITRDNPYIDLPSEGCTLDGLERAKLLKGLKVKLQDVAPDDAVGHIAFGSAEAFGTGKLKVGRLYV